MVRMTKKNEKLRLICRCGTIWPICEKPVSIDDMVKAIKEARCPACNENSDRACIYVGEQNERRAQRSNHKNVE